MNLPKSPDVVGHVAPMLHRLPGALQGDLQTVHLRCSVLKRFGHSRQEKNIDGIVMRRSREKAGRFVYIPGNESE